MDIDEIDNLVNSVLSPSPKNSIFNINNNNNVTEEKRYIYIKMNKL